MFNLVRTNCQRKSYINLLTTLFVCLFVYLSRSVRTWTYYNIVSPWSEREGHMLVHKQLMDRSRPIKSTSLDRQYKVHAGLTGDAYSKEKEGN